MAMPTLVPRYTVQEIRRFPNDGLRYEVIRGDLFVTPAPGTRHQRAVRDLTRRLQDYLERHHLGEAIPSPFEVEFADDTAVQPDVIVILGHQAARLSDERLTGPPALAIEIISYSSKRTDRLQKRDLYQTEGVPEYWVVDVEQRRLERWCPGDLAPTIHTDRVHWQPMAGLDPFEMDLGELFRVAWTRTGGPQR